MKFVFTELSWEDNIHWDPFTAMERSREGFPLS